MNPDETITLDRRQLEYLIFSAMADLSQNNHDIEAYDIKTSTPKGSMTIEKLQFIRYFSLKFVEKLYEFYENPIEKEEIICSKCLRIVFSNLSSYDPDKQRIIETYIIYGYHDVKGSKVCNQCYDQVKDNEE